MMNKLKRLRWDYYMAFSQWQYAVALKKQRIRFYDEALLSQLRRVKFAGFPASVLLLSRQFCEGRCHECTYLLAKSFFDTDATIRIYNADIASLKLHPAVGPQQAEHSFVEQVLPDGQALIYDTTAGVIFDKKTYWQIEHPQVRHVYEKADLMSFGERYEQLLQQREPDLPLVAQQAVEASLQPAMGEIYALPEIAMLQREINLFRKRQQTATQER